MGSRGSEAIQLPSSFRSDPEGGLLSAVEVNATPRKRPGRGRSRRDVVNGPFVASVTVHFHGPIDRRGHAQDLSHPIESGCTTVGDLLAKLGYPEMQRKVIMATVGGEQRKHGFVLSDEDMVEIFVVASGG